MLRRRATALFNPIERDESTRRDSLACESHALFGAPSDMGGGDALAPLPVTASDAERATHYGLVKERLRLLLAGESDWVAAQATVRSEAQPVVARRRVTLFLSRLSQSCTLRSSTTTGRASTATS